MRDIRIRGTSATRELIIWLVLLLVAFFINVYAIVVHSGNWVELITQLHIVLAMSIVLYLAAALLRGVVHGIRKLSYLIANRN